MNVVCGGINYGDVHRCRHVTEGPLDSQLSLGSNWSQCGPD